MKLKIIRVSNYCNPERTQKALNLVYLFKEIFRTKKGQSKPARKIFCRIW